MSRDQLRLAHLVAELEPDAVRVLERIAERLLVGQKQYGHLNIAEDKRDWRHEAECEVLDLSVYAAIRLLKQEG